MAKKIIVGLLVLLVLGTVGLFISYQYRDALYGKSEEDVLKVSQEQRIENQCTQTSCQNECFPNGQRRCAPNCLAGNQYQICGNYDADSCLEWSSRLICPLGQICQNGQCVSRCISECSYSGQIKYRCNGDWRQARTCLNWDVDPCLEWTAWANIKYCSESCQDGKCIISERSHQSPPPPAAPPQPSCPTCQPGRNPF